MEILNEYFTVRKSDEVVRPILSSKRIGFYFKSVCGCIVGNDLETLRSAMDIVAYLGIHLLDWSSKRQTLVTSSTAEAEYVAAYSASRMAVW